MVKIKVDNRKTPTKSPRAQIAPGAPRKRKVAPGALRNTKPLKVQVKDSILKTGEDWNKQGIDGKYVIFPWAWGNALFTKSESVGMQEAIKAYCEVRMTKEAFLAIRAKGNMYNKVKFELLKDIPFQASALTSAVTPSEPVVITVDSASEDDDTETLNGDSDTTNEIIPINRKCCATNDCKNLTSNAFGDLCQDCMFRNNEHYCECGTVISLHRQTCGGRDTDFMCRVAYDENSQEY